MHGENTERLPSLPILIALCDPHRPTPVLPSMSIFRSFQYFYASFAYIFILIPYSFSVNPFDMLRCGQCTHITRNPEPRRVTLENQTSSDYDNSPLQFQTHYTLGRKAPTPLEAFRVCVENSDFGGAE